MNIEHAPCTLYCHEKLIFIIQIIFIISVQHYAPDLTAEENRKRADQGCDGDERQYKQLGPFPFCDIDDSSEYIV